MSLQDNIIDLLSRPENAPIEPAALGEKLGLARRERRKLNFAINQLLSEGRIVRIKGDNLCLPADADLVTGRIMVRQSGHARVIPEVPDGDGRTRAVEIPPGDTGVAWHGDRVIARLDPPRGGFRERRKATARPEERTGKVIRVLERARDTLTGTLQKSHHFYCVVPDDPRFVHDVYVPDPARSGKKTRAAIGDKVIVRLVDWTERHLNPEGEIVEVLGKTFEPGAEMAALLHKYRLDPRFPEAVERDVAGMPDQVRKSDIGGREDLREVFTFTIDPDDAKDFDDALSIEKLPRNRWRVGVHIADVSAYVRPGTALDKEASTRGNSTYLVGTVIPMLPFKLSNGLCSLKEGEDRLTKTVFLTFSQRGALEEADFCNSVIRSSKRLTYKQAFTLLKEDNLDRVRKLPVPPAHQTGATGRPLRDLSNDDLRRLQRAIRDLWRIAHRLRGDRMRKGSLDLDMPETRIFVDENGYADRLEKVENDESHQLIEEFMLAANESVARVLKQNRLPSLYRVHDDPDEDRLNDLREYLATFGVDVGNLAVKSEMSRMLQTLKGHPQGYLLKTQVLRSLKKAVYRATPDGHYGLSKSDYTHFTSPIRRYSDLVVHRIFAQYLVKHLGRPNLPNQPPGYRPAQAESLAEHLSLTEQNSMEAERESVKLKLLEFFDRETSKRKKTAFEAVIVDIRGFGFFIELVESQAYGLVRISRIRDDLYNLNQEGTAFIGRRTKKRYALGERINVVVHRVDKAKRQIDFNPL